MRKSGVPVFDLGDLFQKTKESIFKDACCHINQKGNYVLSQKILEIILPGIHEIIKVKRGQRQALD